MAGAITLGGEASGLLSGAKQIGPSTMSGNAIVGQITDLPLAPGDNTVIVPAEAGAVAIIFSLVYEAPEVRVRTNLDALDGGLPVPAQGWMAFPLLAGVTSLVLFSALNAGTAELTFI
jgi:hypothetical protein